MIPISNYKNFFTELVRRHMAILGPNIARDVALRVPALDIAASGEVIAIDGDPVMVLQDLFRGYSALSAPVAQLVLYDLLEANPAIKAEYNQPMERIKLVCTLLGEERK